MTTIWSSCCALAALIAIFPSVPSRNGSCWNSTALCPLFRDVNCIECEVHYVKLLTVIHEVYKRLTKTHCLYILCGDGSQIHHSHPHADGAHQHLAPQLFINLNHSLTPNLLHCSSCCLLWAFLSGSCLNSLCTALSPLGPRPPLENDLKCHLTGQEKIFQNTSETGKTELMIFDQTSEGSTCYRST